VIIGKRDTTNMETETAPVCATPDNDDDCTPCDLCGDICECEWESRSDEDDSMDGDHDSAMASAGWGTDEDYGCFGIDGLGPDGE